MLNRDNPPEYILSLPGYDLHWHTFVHENESDQQALLRIHAAKLAYLRRKFYEGLHSGRKIYVTNLLHPGSLGEMAALLMELNRHGRATLLCVEPLAVGRGAGEVELLMPGLMRGYVRRPVPDANAGSDDPADWLRVLANAMLLNRGATPSGGVPKCAE